MKNTSILSFATIKIVKCCHALSVNVLFFPSSFQKFSMSIHSSRLFHSDYQALLGTLVGNTSCFHNNNKKKRKNLQVCLNFLVNCI